MVEDTQPEQPRISNDVNVTNEEPISVDVKNDEPLRVRTEQDKVAATRVTVTEKALASAKVDSDAMRAEHVAAANKLRTEDQRRISGIWERTQQIIALSVVEISLLVAAIKAIEATFSDQASTEAGVAFVFLASVANLVIGFYFGRTNHQKVGGDATRDEELAGR